MQPIKVEAFIVGYRVLIWGAIFAVSAFCSSAFASGSDEAGGGNDTNEKEEVSTDVSDEACRLSRYTFSWPYIEDCDMRPRGGTTVGPAVTLDPSLHSGWLSLQEEGLDKFERDRRAILAMAGPYRASFEFLEVAGYTPDFVPDKPYQSWATEYVYVLEDRGDFISLQHIIVMFFVDPEGKVSDPVVLKHWRQDWQYQKTQVLAYVSEQLWEHQTVPESERSGSWSQAVFHVDDSPRYESWGKWEHLDSFSTWESGITGRPLPRREKSVRNDYQLLEAVNRHSILSTGWIHEETNYKVSLEAKGQDKHYLAKELGINRYDRIVDHDFSAGDQYLSATSKYWEDVRFVWREVLARDVSISLKVEVENTPLFSALFFQAKAASEDEKYDSATSRDMIRSVIGSYIED